MKESKKLKSNQLELKQTELEQYQLLSDEQTNARAQSRIAKKRSREINSR